MTETIKSLNSFPEEIIQTSQLSLIEETEDNSHLSAGEVPTWLNEKFVENILNKHEKNSKVKSLTIKPCGGKGESYSSTMYRVGVHYACEDQPEVERNRSLIVKTSATGDVAAEMLGAGSYNVQDKEMDMYQRVLPELKSILESIGEDESFFPMVLGVDKELDAIVLEDLMEKKYVMADRFKGQDLKHVKITLKKIARMHATSIVFMHKNPKALSNFDSGILTRKNKAIHVFFDTMCDTLIEEVSSWKGYNYYAEKLRNIRKDLIENGCKAFDAAEGDFVVLNHGDLWTNNMLFCFNDDGTPRDNVLIDFQLSVVASPAVDLLVS